MDVTSTTAPEPPGPSLLEVPRWLMRIRRNTFHAFCRLSQSHEASLVQIPFLPGRTLYLCRSPEAARHVLQSNHRNYKKAMTYGFLKPVVGEGLLTSEGDMWLRQRRLVAPLFHRQRVEGYAATMRQTVLELLDEWAALPPGEEVDVAEAMSQITLSIAGKLLFGQDIGRKARWIGDDMVLLFRDINRRILSPLSLPRKVPTRQNRRVQGALDRLDDLVYGLIEERRGVAEEHDDLLSLFMLAEDEETGRRMSDKEIRDELLTFVIAGHDTTSNLLSWTFYLLSKHPQVRRRLKEEVDEVVSGRVPTLEEARGLTYVDQVLDETFRLYPPAWTVEREPKEDDVVDGFRVEAGSIVSVGPYFVHHNPRVWKNPEGFDPQRFRPEVRDQIDRYAHFPFGGGPRKCVGADFAMLEARFILAAVVKTMRLDVAPASFVEAEGTITLYPREGLPMAVWPR